ncbi:hypothetical protein ACLVXC_003095 [Vibrio alginolyticus]
MSEVNLEHARSTAERAKPQGVTFEGNNRVLTAYFACPDLVLECVSEIDKLRCECAELREWKRNAEKLSKDIVEPALSLACMDYPASFGPRRNKYEWNTFINGGEK